MSFANRKIKIKAKTWNRDSYGLFDYETTNYNLQNFDVPKPGTIVRLNNEIVCHSQHPPFLPEGNKITSKEDKSKAPKNPEVLAFLTQDSEGIKLGPSPSETSEVNKIWMTVNKNSGVNGYEVKENDTIRLGRVIFRIKQICFESNQSSYKAPNELILDSIKEYMAKKETNKAETRETESADENNTGATCKICLADKGEDDDPLISPCKCMGSVKFVHLKCLQNWVKSKLDIEEAQKLISIFWKNLSCELCKSDLPLYFNHKGTELLLLPLQSKMTGPYVVLESFSKEKDPCGIHVIDLSSKQSFRIGRSHDCELRLNDISVSRVHAILKINQGKLYLKDNYSKFGTLVHLRESIVLDDSNCKSPWLQCGRTVFRLSVRKPWAVALPCLGTIFGISKLCEPKTEKASKGKKVEVPRERLFTNYEDGQREDPLDQNQC